MTEPAVRPKLAVWKFSSCDGCQLSLLSCEDELLALVGQVEIAYFLEASRAEVEGPYDLSLVEGSITTEQDAERIHRVRRVSRQLVTIGACANAGGIQGLRNFTDVEDLVTAVYPSPEYVHTLEYSTPISAHVPVDFELQGCPVNKYQLLEVVRAALGNRKPAIPASSVCQECKLRGQRLRHGCPWHAVPWSRDSCRLRSDMSVVRPRLLRVLRADGVAERQLSDDLVPEAGRG